MKDYKSKTDQELFEIAQGIIDGSIFSSFDVTETDQIQMIFMPLLFLEESTIEEWKKDGPGVLYENVCEAGPRSVNGFPIFTSMKYLDKLDTLKLIEMYKIIQKSRDDLKRQLCGEIDENPNTDASFAGDEYTSLGEHGFDEDVISTDDGSGSEI